MNRTEQEKNTLAYYNNYSQEFLKHRGEGISQYWSKEISLFQKFLPTGIVLEVGCGIGNEAIILNNLGYDYVGTDISEGMLSIARANCPKGVFICQDMRKTETSFEFDGIISIASLLHLDKNEIISTLNTLRHQLRPGGIAFIALKDGIGTEVDSKGRFYSYYSPKEIANLAVDSGFNLLNITIHPEENHNFICCFLENPTQSPTQDQASKKQA